MNPKTKTATVKTKTVKVAKTATKPTAEPVYSNPDRVIALHRMFDKEKAGEPVYILAEGDTVKQVSGTKLDKFLHEVGPGTTIRVTSTAYFIPVLAVLQSRGVVIESCHWHATGLEKGLEGEEIAKGFLKLDAAIMNPVRYREDLYTLRQMVNARLAVMEFRKAAQQKLKATARSMNLADDDVKPDWLQVQEQAVDDLSKENERPIEKAIAKLSATIPECAAMNALLGITGKTSWTTSSTVMAFLGDMERFTQVSSLWHYCGFHVVDGKAPKRAKGVPMTWNPRLRTALWLWADSMLKTRNPIWRPVYDSYLEAEKAVHAGKCDCKTPDGHSGARARRRVIKDVLKEFYLVMNGDQVEGGDQSLFETQAAIVTPKKLTKKAA
jgi:hypothetical protein